MRWQVLSLALLWLCGCVPGPGAELEENSVRTEKEYFFDLRTYMQEEQARLDSLGIEMEKTVQIDGETETRRLTEPDLEVELQLFRESDINRPAWTDKYQADTLTDAGGELRKISYRSTDEDLRVQELVIDWDEAGAVERIQIEKQLTSLIGQLRQVLIYEPQVGYRLEEAQSSRWRPDRKVKVEVSFR